MVRYPIGVQSFEDIRTGNYVYVDKTRFINPLINAGKCVFLSRPRRFGKSLLLSMLDCYFQGRKDLFEGLDISREETEWKKYPVVHIDFSNTSFSEDGVLNEFLLSTVWDIAADYEVELPEMRNPAFLFSQLLKRISKKLGTKLVVLIDEYDSAIIDAADNEDLKKKHSEILRGFYKVLKPADQYLQFTMLTGVVRVEQLSIFSGLNNLVDITMDEPFADICGINKEELETNFQPGIASLAEKRGWSFEQTIEELRERYNGYRFTPSPITVINPFSLLLVLSKRTFDDYWVKSGTSKIFISYLKMPDFFLPDVTDRWYSSSQLEQTFNSPDPVSLMFQTGYLTVAECDGEGSYRLRYPNEEVTRGLLDILVPTFMHGGIENKNMTRRLTVMRRSIESGDVDALMRELQSMIGSVPYDDWDHERREKHFETMMYLIFMMLNINSRCQTHVSSGRIDMVATTKDYVYIFEYKLDTDPKKALEQIDTKDYALSWSADGRQVIKVGVDFSTKTNTIARWAIA